MTTASMKTVFDFFPDFDPYRPMLADLNLTRINEDCGNGDED